MKIDNPFESGQIKSYLLFYAAVVVIMILFFIASSLFNDIKVEKTKVFDTNVTAKKVPLIIKENTAKENNSSIILMKKNIY